MKNLINKIKLLVVKLVLKKSYIENVSTSSTKSIKSEQQLVANIMSNFNFNKVHQVMGSLKWKWATSEGYKVPTVVELRRKAKKELTTAISYAKSKNHNNTENIPLILESGGFKVIAFVSKDYTKIEVLELQFIVEKWYEENYS
jgi:hypothetical protein